MFQSTGSELQSAEWAATGMPERSAALTVRDQILLAFQSLQPGDSVTFPDVSSLVSLANGFALAGFPAVADGVVDSQRRSYVGIGRACRAIGLTIVALDKCTFKLDFPFEDLQGAPGSATIVWHRDGYYLPESYANRKLAEGYELLRDPACRSVFVGDVSALLTEVSSALRLTTLLPNGNRLAEPIFFGAGDKTTSVDLHLEKTESRGVCFVFHCHRGDGDTVVRRCYWSDERLVRADEYESALIAAAYRELRPGESRSIGDITDIPSVRLGLLPTTFPTPASSLGAPLYTGTGKGIITLTLDVDCVGVDSFLLRFSYTAIKAGVVVSGTSELTWDGTQLFRPELESERALFRTLEGLYQTLPVFSSGPEVDITELTGLEKGFLAGRFPLPDGECLSEPFYTSVGTHLSALYVTPVRTGEDTWTFALRGVESDTNISRFTELYWDGLKLRVNQAQAIVELRAIYEEIDVVGGRSLRDVRSLVSDYTGALSRRFPLPIEGRQLDDNAWLGIPSDAERVALTVEREGSTELRYTFHVFMSGDVAPSSTVRIYWTGRELESSEQRSIRLMRRAMEGLEVGECSGPIDVSPLVALTYGKLSQRFPTPDGGQLGDLLFHVSQDLTGVTVRITRRADQEFKLELTGHLAEERGDRVVTLMWSEGRYEAHARYQARHVHTLLRSLEVGESVESSEFSELISSASGVLAAFPAPVDEAPREGIRKDIGLAAGDTIEKLELTRTDAHEFTCTVTFERAGCERKSSFFWRDGAWLTLRELQGESLERVLASHDINKNQRGRILNRSKHTPRIRSAFQSLAVGERTELGSINELIYFRTGQLKSSFPEPEGSSSIGKELSIGIKSDTENVDLSIERLGEKFWRLDFTVTRGRAQVPSLVTIYWKANTYITARELETEQLRTAVAEIQAGKVREVGSVRNLMSVPGGILYSNLPLPNGNVLSSQRAIGATGIVADVKVTLVRLDETWVQYDFHVQTTRGESVVNSFYSDGTQFLDASEYTVAAIRRAFAEIKAGGRIEIGDITSIINGPSGVLSAKFPLPIEGKVLDQQTYFGACEKLTAVTLAVELDEKGRLQLDFGYRSEIKDSEQSCRRVWDGVSYNSEEDLFIAEVREAFTSLAIGERQAFTNVSALVSMPSGILSAKLPTPIPGKSVGRQIYGSLPRPLASAGLTIERINETEYNLVFPATTTTDIDPEPGFLRWTGSEYLTREKWERQLLKAAFDELKPGEAREIEGTQTLIDLAAGALFSTFITPAGARIGEKLYIGASEDLKEASFTVRCTGENRFELAFTYVRDREGALPATATLLWDGVRFVTPVDLQVEELKQLYRDMAPGESRAAGEITPLVYQPAGYFTAKFPVPGPSENGVGKTRLKGGYPLERIDLTVERVSGEEYWLHLNCRATGAETPTSVSHFWDGAVLTHKAELTTASPFPVHLLKGRIFEQLLLKHYYAVHGEALRHENTFCASQITGEIRKPDYFVAGSLLDDAKWGRSPQDIVETALKYERLRRLCGLSEAAAIVFCDASQLGEVEAVVRTSRELLIPVSLRSFDQQLKILGVSESDCACDHDLLRAVKRYVARNDAAQLEQLYQGLEKLPVLQAHDAVALPAPLRDESVWQVRLRNLLREAPELFIADLENLERHHSPYWEWGYHKRLVTMLSMVAAKVEFENLSSERRQYISTLIERMYPGLTAASGKALWQKAVRFEKLIAAERRKKDKDSLSGPEALEYSIELREREMRKLEGACIDRFDLRAFEKFISDKSAGLQRGLGAEAHDIQVHDFWGDGAPEIEGGGVLSSSITTPNDPAEEQSIRERTFLEVIFETARDAKNASEAVTLCLDELTKLEAREGGAWRAETADLRQRIVELVTARFATECCSNPKLYTKYPFIEGWKTRKEAVTFDELCRDVQRLAGTHLFAVSARDVLGSQIVKELRELRRHLGGSRKRGKTSR